jgi:putative redox protein
MNTPIVVEAFAESDPYLTTVVYDGGALNADEKLISGGQGRGPTPGDLLAASLATCTVITLKMYAARKGWANQAISSKVEVITDAGETRFIRNIKLDDTLSFDQRERMLQIAEKCPVHKILSGSISIQTSLSL